MIYFYENITLSFITFISAYYYSVGLLILVEIVALYVAIKNYRQHRRLRVFVYYTLFSLLQILTPYLLGGVANRVLSERIFGIVSNGFMFFEFTVCALYVYMHLTGRARKRAVVIDALVFLLVLSWVILRRPESIFHPVFFFFESFFLLLPCLLYIYDLFVNPPPGKLRDYPSFWVVTGFLVLNGCSVPLLLGGELMSRFGTYEYVVNFSLYMVLFLSLMRAYYCAPVNRTDNAPT
jgi:hypothetical protein